MKRMVVVKTENGISCLPVSDSKEVIGEKYEVITYVNKLWNFHNVTKIKSYFNR